MLLQSLLRIKVVNLVFRWNPKSRITILANVSSSYVNYIKHFFKLISLKHIRNMTSDRYRLWKNDASSLRAIRNVQSSFSVNRESDYKTQAGFSLVRLLFSPVPIWSGKSGVSWPSPILLSGAVCSCWFGKPGEAGLARWTWLHGKFPARFARIPANRASSVFM